MANEHKPIRPQDVGESGPAFLLDHTDPAGAPQPQVWRQAVADFYQLDLDASVSWKQIGPAPLLVDAEQIYMGAGPDSGEVTCIAIDPTGASDQILYITTDDGGIWKTADAGLTWTPLTDQMFSISMGAVALDAANPNILYGGSGNLFDGGAAFTKGAGVYRSADAGLTWSIVDGGYFGTLFANVGISGIASPAGNCLLVATSQGLYRSIDGGRNFGVNAPAFDNRKPVVAGKICCLLLDSAHPSQVVYAGVAGDSVDSAGNPTPITGLLKSTDGGASFPANLFANPGAPAAPYASFALAQSQFDGATPNSAILYLSVQNNTVDANNNPISVYVGLFRSSDSGATWTILNNLSTVAATDGFNQTYYDLTLGVDPVNSQRVYAGFQQLWRSTDGGNTFETTAVTANKVHWDNHAIVLSPPSHRPAAPAAPPAPTTLYTGTDGGIAKSTDGGDTWTPINGSASGPVAGSIATNLFRGIDIGRGPANNMYTYGGCQDTGTSGLRNGDTPGKWHAGINGDGWLVAVDPVDPTTVYGFDDGYLIKTTDAGATWNNAGNNPAIIGAGLPAPDPYYPSAIAIDQSGANPAARTVYVSSGDAVYKSVNSGVSFAKTSLTYVATPPAPSDAIVCLVTPPASAGTAFAGLIWAGATDGSVHRSTDAGVTWDAPPFTANPSGASGMWPVNHIAIDPANPSRVAAVFGGFSTIQSKFKTNHVYLTLDSGASWHDISGTDGQGPTGNLPDLTVRSVVFDTSTVPSAIVIAGDAGVLRSTNATITGAGVTAVASATWKIYGAGLPMVCCNSLAIDNSVTPHILRVGTYGRSCFEISRPAGPSFAIDANLAFGAVVQAQSATLTCYLYNCGDAPLTIASATIAGATPYRVEPAPTLPVSIAPGATQAFQITFTPTAPGDAFATLVFDTNDPIQAVQSIPLSGTGVHTGLNPRLASNPIGSIGFGPVLLGANRTVSLQLFNVGAGPLQITAIARTSGSNDIALSPTPGFPVTIPPGGETGVTLQYTPTAIGSATATFSISSNDALSPATITANAKCVQTAPN